MTGQSLLGPLNQVVVVDQAPSSHRRPLAASPLQENLTIRFQGQLRQHDLLLVSVDLKKREHFSGPTHRL